MAVIPRLNPSVGYGRLPKPDLSPISRGGAALGRGLAQLGEGLGAIVKQVEQIQEDRDIAKAHEAVMAFSDDARAKYAEMKARQGGDAAGVHDDYKTWFDSQVRTITGKLTGQRQREIFQSSALSRRSRDLDSLSQYEADEHRQYMGSRATAEFSSSLQDAALYSDDPKRIDDLADNVSAWVDASNPGMDNTAKKFDYVSRLRLTALTEQTRKNPVLAKSMLEKWRTSLGPLADAAAKEVDKEFYYFEAKTQHPGRFNSQYDYVSKLRQVDEDTKRQVMARIESDQAEAMERERQAEHNLTVSTKFNDQKAITDYFEGRLNHAGLSQLANRGMISKETTKFLYEDMRDPVKNDNPIIAGDLWTLAIRNSSEFYSEASRQLAAGNLTTKTYIAMRRAFEDDKHKNAISYVEDAMKPSLIDRWSPDKNVRFAEAMSRFNELVSRGVNPKEAAASTVDEYLGNIRRTIRGLPRPSKLQGEKTDYNALEAARSETAAAYARGEIGTDEYTYQIENIERLMELSRDLGEGLTEDQKKELQKLRDKNLVSD